MSESMRVFADANILIRAVTFPRFPYEVLQHGARGDFALILSPLVVKGARQYIHKLYPGYEQALELLLQYLEYELVPDPSPDSVAEQTGLVRDSKNIPVALAAIRANADYLVSTDRDLIDVDDSTARLRQYIKLVAPGAFLQQVMGWSHEALSAIERRRWSDLERPFWEEE